MGIVFRRFKIFAKKKGAQKAPLKNFFNPTVKI
jgi:hypothetical protein